VLPVGGFTVEGVPLLGLFEFVAFGFDPGFEVSGFDPGLVALGLVAFGFVVPGEPEPAPGVEGVVCGVVAVGGGAAPVGGAADPGVELCPVPLPADPLLPADPAEPALCATTQAEHPRRTNTMANFFADFIVCPLI
jgi:hypothetical protein